MDGKNLPGIYSVQNFTLFLVVHFIFNTKATLGGTSKKSEAVRVPSSEDKKYENLGHPSRSQLNSLINGLANPLNAAIVF